MGTSGHLKFASIFKWKIEAFTRKLETEKLICSKTPQKVVWVAALKQFKY
jgi:hypothetical protein